MGRKILTETLDHVACRMSWCIERFDPMVADRERLLAMQYRQERKARLGRAHALLLAPENDRATLTQPHSDRHDDGSDRRPKIAIRKPHAFVSA